MKGSFEDEPTQLGKGWGYAKPPDWVMWDPKKWKRHWWVAGQNTTACKRVEQIGPIRDDEEFGLDDSDPQNCKFCLRVLRQDQGTMGRSW